MSFTSRGTSEILVAGLQNVMFVIEVNRGEIVKQVRDTLSCSCSESEAGSDERFHRQC